MKIWLETGWSFWYQSRQTNCFLSKQTNNHRLWRRWTQRNAALGIEYGHNEVDSKSSRSGGKSNSTVTPKEFHISCVKSSYIDKLYLGVIGIRVQDAVTSEQWLESSGICFPSIWFIQLKCAIRAFSRLIVGGSDNEMSSCVVEYHIVLNH